MHRSTDHLALPPLAVAESRLIPSRAASCCCHCAVLWQHSWLNPSMSLSKLRRCKSLLLSLGLELDLELSTVALACVYLERLCWRNVLDKKNRKLASAACLTLAWKWNEAVQHNVKHKQLNQLFAVRTHCTTPHPPQRSSTVPTTHSAGRCSATGR